MAVKDKVTTVFLVLMASAVVSAYPPIVRVKPQQIHISYWSSPNQMMIMWSQTDRSKLSIVRYGINGKLTHEKRGNSTAFVDGGIWQRTQYMSTVLLDDLVPGQTYTYIVGNEYEFSDEHMFRAMRAGQNWSPRLAIYGDMGNVNARSLPRLEADAFAGMYDAVLHVGDMGYDMFEMDGKLGDEFMNQIEPLASQLPYMTCPGNHEERYNFSHYRHRFTMPGDEGKMYYSFNMGPVHFVSLSTEFFFFWYYGPMQIYQQYEWLKQDLKEAASPENRSKRPWIVVFGHRPMYCSSTGTDDCTKHESILRKGIPFLHMFGLEDVLYDHGVDLAIWAHEHSYERLWPVYDRKVMNGSYDAPYTNPRAPVQIITGSAGCRENVSGFIKDPADWSAFHSMDYGYTRMHVLNKTHMYLEQVSDVKNGQVIDKFTIIKTYHGPYDKTGKQRAPDLPEHVKKAAGIVSPQRKRQK
ncbi:acid phosphatase type 7 [Aplysia californica]|uniref:Purple acid phosphatase n=1 Tax=Aplysia californica TaxID=6500 RepID=A0ABM0JU15_APLCA|nr:acid phosphatase type 7 [Aplysia californica]